VTIPEPDHDPESVERLADEILSRDEFRRPFTEEAWTWITDRVGGFFESLGGVGGGAFVAWAILVVIVAVVVFLLVRLARTLQGDRRETVDVSVVERRPARDWLREAEELEAQGSWRDGLRCRYRALVGELVERRVLRDVPGRTAGEFRREVADATPSAEGDFGGATDLFEAAWYGHRDTGEPESRAFKDLADEVLRTARR
jgi:hypothetical protein